MTPEGWGRGSLFDLAELIMGQAPPSALVHEDLSQGLPFIQGNAEFGARYPNPRKSCSDPARVAEPGDLLLSVRAPVGALNRARERLAIGRGLAAIRVREIDPDFAWYAVRARVGDLTRLSQGSTFEAVNKDALGSLILPRPPLGEQRKIAAILSSVDETIEATLAVIDQLGVVKKAMMAELLTRGIPGRHTKFEQTEIGEVPEGWAVASLSDIAASAPNAIVDGPFGSNLKSEHYRSSGIPVIQSGFVTSCEWSPQSYVFVEQMLFEQQRRSAVGPGDIVMAKIGANAGACARVPLEHPVGILAGNSLKITLGSQVDSQFILHTLHHERDSGRLDCLRSTTAQPAISLGSLKKYRVRLPALEEQGKIAAILDSIVVRSKDEFARLSELTRVKSALVSVLLTGELRVKPDKAAP